ncbi:MAG: hypothetical protein M9894_12690 [Planctomycetes bacterium]|nr:hypothetical protein [Planctomycetota bacterium]
MTTSRSGVSLVDVSIGLAVFAGLALTVAMALTAGSRGGESAWRHSVAQSLLRDKLAEMQEAANVDMKDVYVAYHGTWDKPTGSGTINTTGKDFAVPELPHGNLNIRLYKNESGAGAPTPGATISGRPDRATAYIPAELGGARDLNGDGDMNDELGPTADDARLLPARLELTWRDSTGVVERIVVHALIGSTTNLNN